MSASKAAAPGGLVDPCGRAITYLRLSVTDRCDLRCVYCRAPGPPALPWERLLSLDELDRLVAAFVSLGVTRVRITGGEPLARRGVVDLVARIGRHLRSGALEELSLTTNGTRLAHAATALAAAGVRRVNVSVDSLDPEVYARVTRGGRLSDALAGIEAAHEAGLRVKINVVVLRRENAAEVPELVAWAHRRGHDVSLIEIMPMGAIGADRGAQFVSLASVREELARRYTLVPSPSRTAGPSREFRVQETGGLLGFITPLSHGFCGQCNRIRVTSAGVLHPCLGHEEQVDLRPALRAAPGDDRPLLRAIREGVALKPRRHQFHIGDRSLGSLRTMAVTGG